MNTEQLRKEFESEFTRYGFDFDRIQVAYTNDQTHGAWLGYQAAAQARDELIEKLYHALNVYLMAGFKEARREASVIAKKALAEAKAHGYGE